MAPERVTERIIPLEMVEDHCHPIGDHIANPQVGETIARLRNLMVMTEVDLILKVQELVADLTPDIDHSHLLCQVTNPAHQEVVCYYCRGKGHYKRLCPVMYKEMLAHFQKGQI